MRAVFWWELKRRKLFTLWWIIGASSLIAMTILAYRTFGTHTQQLNQAFNSLSSSAGSFFGGSDFFSPIGYLSSQVYYLTLPMLIIIMVTSLASGLMNRDENDTTVELTLARSISRRQLLAAKALAGLVIAIVVCLLTFLVALGSTKAAELPISGGHLLLTHLVSFGFALSFGVIGFSLMAASRLTRRYANTLAVLLAFGGYTISSLASFVSALHWPAKLMPYHYFNTVGLLNGHIDVGLLWYFGGVIVIGIVIAVTGYSRRDIG